MTAPKKHEVATVERATVVQPPSGPSDAGALMAAILRASSEPNVDIVKTRELMTMYREIISEQKEQAFNDAMADAQKEMRRIATDKDNTQTRSRYASYAALDRAIRPIYTQHGFSLSFDTEPIEQESYLRVVCYVSACGHTRKYKIDMPADGKGAKGGDVMTKTHATGSAASYGRRYLLMMIFNLAVSDDADDDGNAAGGGDRISGDRITAEQVRELSDKLAAAKAPLSKFLKWARVARLEDIGADIYESCVQAAESFAKAKAQ